MQLDANCIFSAHDLHIIQVRCTCIRSLGKIAILSEDPLRLHIYEFLLLLSLDEHLSISSLVSPLLRLLDDMYAFQSRLLAEKV